MVFILLVAAFTILLTANRDDPTYSLRRDHLFLKKLNASRCPTELLATELKIRPISCFLMPEFSVIAQSKYRLRSHVSLVQPRACRSKSFSEPTFVSRYICHAKSHSTCHQLELPCNIQLSSNSGKLGYSDLGSVCYANCEIDSLHFAHSRHDRSYMPKLARRCG